MNSILLKPAFELLDRGWLPDAAVRAGIRRLCAQRLRELAAGGDDAESFIQAMDAGPIAPHTDKANEQHYEVPAEFYEHCLGPHRKYSCCHFDAADTTLHEAETSALAMTCEHADLRDGQDILELGCGWGSLTLWMAQRHPTSRITAVSNSHSQRRFIESRAAELGLHNVRVLTCDMNVFDTDDTFDRVVSVEMFEHMRNYRALLRRVSNWLRPNGKLFVHIFCHRDRTYPFETGGAANWMGRHFFTGGIMPAFDLFDHFDDDLAVTQRWRLNGRHYQRTADAWLANLDRNRDRVMPVLAETYGQTHASRWFNRWRVFFMACSELWGYRGGEEWFVGHYLLEPVRKQVNQTTEARPCEPQLV